MIENETDEREHGGRVVSFAIEPSGRVQPDVRRVAMECLDRALHKLDGLDGETAEAIEEAVHDVRKRCKEVRALARLVRRSLGPEWRRFDLLVRDASDELSSIRDAHAVAATLHDLRAAGRGGDDRELEVVAATQSRMAAQATETVKAGDDRIRRARKLLKSARKRIDRWEVEAGSEWLAVGLDTTYRRGRKELRRARNRPTDARLHDWRKSVKTLWYQTRLIEAAAPSVLSPLVARLDDLAEALGDDHDLSVLVERLESDPARYGGKKSVKRTVKRARVEQDDLRTRAFRLGASLYAEPAPAFVARIGRYWSLTIETGPELPTGGISELAERMDAAEQSSDGAGSDDLGSASNPMVELERKFLVAEEPDFADGGTTLRQGYLAVDGSVSVRVRDAGPNGCTLTVKAGHGAVRSELEWVIDRADFEALWPATAGRRIDKVRFCVGVDGGPDGPRDLVAEVDVFHGDLEGLVLAEVEFETVDMMRRFVPPSWFGAEVTDDVSFTNAALSTRPRP